MRYVLGSSIIEAAVIRSGTFCVVGHDCWACLGCLGVTPARWSVGLLPNLVSRQAHTRAPRLLHRMDQRDMRANPQMILRVCKQLLDSHLGNFWMGQRRGSKTVHLSRHVSTVFPC